MLLVLKEMHSHEPRAHENKKKQKCNRPPWRTQDFHNRTNLSLFLSNNTASVNKDHLLDHPQSFGDSMILKGKKIISEELSCCAAIMSFSEIFAYDTLDSYGEKTYAFVISLVCIHFITINTVEKHIHTRLPVFLFLSIPVYPRLKRNESSVVSSKYILKSKLMNPLL